MNDWIEKIGIVSSVALPFFNIPLIAKLLKRKSSEDFSLAWVTGVWVCIILMTPNALRSQDTAFRLFGIVNILFFSVVAILIYRYRIKS